MNAAQRARSEHPMGRGCAAICVQRKSAPIGTSTKTKEAIWQLGFLAPAGVLGVATAWSWIFPDTAQAWAFAVLALSIVAIGFPHGACDWLALRRADSSLSRRQIVVFVGAYLVAAALTLALWKASAALGFAFFLLVTAWHWGEGDCWLVLARRESRALGAWGRGLLLMSAPLAFQKEACETALAPLLALSAGASQTLAPLFESAPLVLVVALSLQMLAVWHELQGRILAPLSRELGWWIIVETLLLLLFWSLVPPLLGVALYLCGVHGWRHLLRLQTGGGREKAPPRVRELLGWQNAAWPITLVALAALPICFVLWPTLLHTLGGWSAAYLLLIAALTSPHAGTIVFLVARKRL